MNDQVNLGNIELAAYRRNNNVIIEVSSSQMICCESLTDNKKMDDIRRKIEKNNGYIEFNESGHKVRIILPAE